MLDDDLDTAEEDQYIYIQLQFEAVENPDKNMIITSILSENKDVFEDLSEIKDVSAIGIDSLIPLVNKQRDEVNNPVIVM